LHKTNTYKDATHENMLTLSEYDFVRFTFGSGTYRDKPFELKSYK